VQVKTPKSLEKVVKKQFKKHNLKSYITLEGDCYRVTVFDKSADQTMMWIPLMMESSNSEIAEQCMVYAKEKYPELFGDV